MNAEAIRKVKKELRISKTDLETAIRVTLNKFNTLHPNIEVSVDACSRHESLPSGENITTGFSVNVYVSI